MRTPRRSVVRATSALLKYGLTGISRAGTLHPVARRWRRGVEVIRGVPYLGDGPEHHCLDIYRPVQRRGPLPVMVYIHGGGFRILSKDTHWMFGYGFAQRGWLVFNINYRLAPEHRFPAAVEDAAAALEWVVANASTYGADVGRLALAGESAGANLALSLAVCGSWSRPEPYAQRLYALGVRPYAVVAACGLLQVSQPERYLSQTHLPEWIRARVQAVCRGYLPSDDGDPDRFALADPLRVIESACAPERPLPAIFAPCGRADPVADDSRRLAAALTRRGSSFEAPWYDGHHAFHAFIWTAEARRCWADQDAFLRRHMPRSGD
ncbi:MAG: alpha/beta hydrolase [Myxococcota bacterium]